MSHFDVSFQIGVYATVLILLCTFVIICVARYYDHRIMRITKRTNKLILKMEHEFSDKMRLIISNERCSNESIKIANDYYAETELSNNNDFMRKVINAVDEVKENNQ